MFTLFLKVGFKSIVTAFKYVDIRRRDSQLDAIIDQIQNFYILWLAVFGLWPILVR